MEARLGDGEEGSSELPLTAQRAAELLPAGPPWLSSTVTDDVDVVLSWDAVEDFAYLYEYEISRWRPVYGGSELRGVPEVFARTGSTETSGTDDAEPGELCRYQVRAASFLNAISQRTEPL